MPSKFWNTAAGRFTDKILHIFNSSKEPTPQERVAHGLAPFIEKFQEIEKLSEGALVMVAEPEDSPQRLSLKTQDAESFPKDYMRMITGNPEPPEMSDTLTVFARPGNFGSVIIDIISHDQNEMVPAPGPDTGNDLYVRKSDFNSAILDKYDEESIAEHLDNFIQRALSPADYSKVNPKGAALATRKVFSQPLGGIISDLLGEDRVKELLDQQDVDGVDHSQQSVGELALEMGVISKETKNALLMAQAAERSFDLSNFAAAVDSLRERQIRHKRKVTENKKCPHDDPVFKYVGSERDPENLQYAQGVWMAAQMLMNNEIDALNGVIENPGFVANPKPQGPDAAAGFKNAAMDIFRESIGILKQEGHNEAAERLEHVVQSHGGEPSKTAIVPSQVMKNIAENFERGSHDLKDALRDRRYLEHQPIQDVYTRLQKLTQREELDSKTASLSVTRKVTAKLT